MLKLPAILLVIISIATFARAQESKPTTYPVEGVIRDHDQAVFPGLRIRFKNDTVDATTFIDIDGRFHHLLPQGDYVMTVDGLNTKDFQAFIVLGPNRLNPNFLTLIVDWKKSDCLAYSRSRVPTITKVTLPSHAIMARAAGEVTVQVEISQDGIVLSAKGISGHPLLRAASVKAAEKIVFESAESSQLRQALLTFVFHWNSETGRKLKRESCPGRFVIAAPDQTVLITEH